jgi:hypothetical protein
VACRYQHLGEEGKKDVVISEELHKKWWDNTDADETYAIKEVRPERSTPAPSHRAGQEVARCR